MRGLGNAVQSREEKIARFRREKELSNRIAELEKRWKQVAGWQKTKQNGLQHQTVDKDEMNDEDDLSNVSRHISSGDGTQGRGIVSV